MKQIIILLSLIGALGCSMKNPKENPTETVLPAEIKAEASEINNETRTERRPYAEIVLKENKIDSFPIPFSEKDMIMPLRKYYAPYRVEAKIGQQDGPDFTYIEIAKDNDKPVVYFIFNPENKYDLDEIRIFDTSAVDEYGVSVGDTYEELIKKRPAAYKNSTDYHQHTYLYTDNSNIYYELTGDIPTTGEMLENIEELDLNEKQLKNFKVEYIIWRKRK